MPCRHACSTTDLGESGSCARDRVSVIVEDGVEAITGAVTSAFLGAFSAFKTAGPGCQPLRLVGKAFLSLQDALSV